MDLKDFYLEEHWQLLMISTHCPVSLLLSVGIILSDQELGAEQDLANLSSREEYQTSDPRWFTVNQPGDSLELPGKGTPFYGASYIER